MVENGSGIGVGASEFSVEAVREFPPTEIKEFDLEPDSADSQEVLAEKSANGASEFPLLRDVDLRRITRRFRLVPGGELKPRLDCGARGTATWAFDTVKELQDKKDERVASALRRRALEEKFMKSVLEESLFSPDPEIPEIKPWQRKPKLKNYNRVAPLNTQPGILGWQTVRTSI